MIPVVVDRLLVRLPLRRPAWAAPVLGLRSHFGKALEAISRRIRWPFWNAWLVFQQSMS
jgi:hypothetical protein